MSPLPCHHLDAECLSCHELLDVSEHRWIPIEEALPEIPEGQYGVQVLVVTYDSVYEEISPGNGYSVHQCSWGSTRNKDGSRLRLFSEEHSDEFDFLELYIGGEGGSEWGPTGDPVIAWRYMPKYERPHK